MDPIWLSELANNNSTNISDISLLSLEALSNKWQVFLIILYSTTAAVSLVINIITIIVLFNGERISSEIWKFLLNLSISDILMSLFSIPFTYTIFMLGRWIFPKCLCPFVQFAQLCSVFISVYTLTAIGIDRYFAIVHPFRLLMWIKTHKECVITGIWIIGLLFASVQLVKSRAVPFQYGSETYYDCREEWSESDGKLYTAAIFTLTFAMPAIILVFVYGSVGWTIIRHNIPGNPDTVRDLTQLNIKIKVVKMLILIVIMFAICWTPIQLFGLIVWFYPQSLDTDLKYNLYVGLYFASHWLSMSHSFINPLIYSYMSSNFRNDLWKLLRRLKPKLFRSFTDFNLNNNFQLSSSQYSHEITYNYN